MRINRLLLSKVLSILLYISLILPVKAEATMWTQTYGGTNEERAYSLIITSDNGYAIAGYTSSNNGDFWLVKTDGNGVAPVVPEAVWVILHLLLAATVSIFICKKKLLHPRLEKR